MVITANYDFCGKQWIVDGSTSAILPVYQTYNYNYYCYNYLYSCSLTIRIYDIQITNAGLHLASTYNSSSNSSKWDLQIWGSAIISNVRLDVFYDATAGTLNGMHTIQTTQCCSLPMQELSI